VAERRADVGFVAGAGFRGILDSDLADLRAREINNAREAIARTPERVARVVGVNTERWSLVRFDYWRCEQKALPAGSRSYEALHVSAPNPGQLKPT
jgi:hypothetical protein